MSYFIGLMSGTSLDGVDGVLVQLNDSGTQCDLRAAYHVPFSLELQRSLLALQSSGADEIHRTAIAANQLMRLYTQCVQNLLHETGIAPQQVVAIGAHGQTVRHRPDLGYTLQISNPALLAELTQIDVIADFRSRDIAAAGQGAPLVPACHRSLFGQPNQTRVVINIGGISNISILRADGSTHGFDTGPGNVLMDMWVMQHKGQSYDANGDWARQGQVDCFLLAHLKDEPYLQQTPPKSTGRDLFHAAWLVQKLAGFATSPVDVQATLCAFTAHTLVDAISQYARDVEHIFVCGGGVFNGALMDAIQLALKLANLSVSLESTQAVGVFPNHVEALAFAWLAYRHKARLPGNVPDVTGAAGERILGACYPR